VIAFVVTAASRSHFAVGQNPRARLVRRYIHTARWVMSGGKREPEYEIGGMPAADDVHLHPKPANVTSPVAARLTWHARLVRLVARGQACFPYGLCPLWMDPNFM
jgi:hypothetical protein